MNRRTYCLAVGSTGVASLAGCLDTISGTIIGGDDGYIRPDEDPEHVPDSFRCDREGFERYEKMYNEDNLYWGDVDHFSLRVNSLEFEYGDTAEIELTHEDQRGIDEKFNFEIYTGNGWQDVRENNDKVGYDDNALPSDAEWNIELTEEGIVEQAGGWADRFEVCSALVSGRYRFDFWGIGRAETETGLENPGIAVAFDLAV